MIWQANNYTSTMKLMNLMMAFDYAEAGNKMISAYLNMADSSIAVNVRPVLDEMLKNIENQGSVTENLEKLRRIVSLSGLR